MQFTTFLRRKFFAAVLSLGCSLSALGQARETIPATTAMKAVAEQVEGDWTDGRWNQADVGPFMSAAIHTPQGRTLKGIAIKVGDTAQATVCFNTELLGYSAAWADGFLEFDPRRYGLIGGPKPKGRTLFANGITPGWMHDGKLDDPRTRKLGPLPRSRAKYRGLYRHGKRVALSYTVGETTVLDEPWAGDADGRLFLTRTLEFGQAAKPLTALIATKRGATAVLQKISGLAVAQLPAGDETLWVAALGQGTGLAVKNDRILLTVQPGAAKRLAKVFIVQAPLGQAESVVALAKANAVIEPPSRLASGGPGLWPPLATRGVVGKPRGAFAIDTIRLPFDNPWNALLFTAGHDFLPDGSALVCTVHGDVWRLTGIDSSLKKVTWHRFATGLFQPLGLKVVGGNAYVIGRDQITRLHDLNGDGEADFYECFNNDLLSAGGGHAYATSLETDSRGNFYFTKCSEGTAHGGSLIRISADGGKLDVFATGFRNPNGLGIGPGDVITVGDQQGGWVPETRVDVMRRRRVLRLHADASSRHETGDVRPAVCVRAAGARQLRRGAGVGAARAMGRAWRADDSPVVRPVHRAAGPTGRGASRAGCDVAAPRSLPLGRDARPVQSARRPPVRERDARLADGGGTRRLFPAATICRWRAPAADPLRHANGRTGVELRREARP